MKTTCNESALVLGNVVGANIANITLIVGGAATLRNMQIEKTMLQRDGYLAFIVGILLIIFALNGAINRWEGILFVMLFIAYTFFLIQSSSP